MVSNTQAGPSNQYQTIQNVCNLWDNDNVCKEIHMEFEKEGLNENIQG
jgi:hypothetical protein